MTNDELIRVLASMRTDLNDKRLALMAVPGQLEHAVLEEHGLDIEVRQEEALGLLKGAVTRLNDIIQILGGKA